MTKIAENIQTKEEKIEKRISRSWKFFVSLIILGFAVAILGIFVFEMNGKEEVEKFGNFSSGTVAALWSLAGIILIYIAFLGQKLELLIQKDELQLNRKELEETRIVLNEQKKEFEIQNKTLLKQTFENLFFQMLRNFTDIVDRIKVTKTGNDLLGRECFKELYRLFKKKYGKFGDNTEEANRINESYIEFFKTFQIDLGNYFRSLYHLVKLINNSDMEDKRMYTNIVRAQLSAYELALLFYNCLSGNGKIRFKPLVEEYNLMKNLPKDLLISPDHVNLYSGVMFEEDEIKDQ